MRDSASFKLITEFNVRGFRVFGYDPFFKSDHIDKYLVENKLEKISFQVVDNINDEILRDIGCLCIVQHHEISKRQINQIYEQSLVPFIYDCQSKIHRNPSSKTILDFLGD